MKATSLRDIRKRFMAQPEKYLNLKKQRGMTLLEIIIVLGIIGTIAAGVVILAQRAYDSQAQSDLSSNTNTVRTAVKAAYGPSGVYPVVQGAATLALNDTNIQTEGANSPIGKLILLGQLSASEAKNNISNNFFNIGAASIGTSGTRKGYYIEVNGLSQTQCRNLLLQAGNQFDFVSVVGNDNTGSYTSPTTLDLTVTAAAFHPGTASQPDGSGGTDASMDATGVYRSLNADGNNVITADAVIGACNDDSANGIILGSR
ncbi:type IV pilus major pilin [Salmonella enterica subsp. enterica serovar Muenchen]|nr:type IV pilus major pilin [Salmonella enterica subsp. enterica serovar Muenchen]